VESVSTTIRSTLRHGAILLSGNIGASLLGLLSLGLTARALSIEQLGSLVIALSIVTVIDKLCNFQSWQAYIKFTTDIKYGEIDLNQNWLYRFCLALDTLTAAIGTLLSLTTFYIAHTRFAMDYDIAIAGGILSLTIATNITGTFIGVLRLAKQYASLAKANIAAAAVKLGFILLLYLYGAPYVYFCIAWAVGLITLNITTIIYGFKHADRAPKTTTQNITARATIIRFVLASNLQGSIKTVRKEGEVLLIGALLGTPAVAIYKIARQISQILARLTDPIAQTLLPTITEILVNNEISYYLEYRRRVHWILGLSSASLCIVWAMGADWLIAFGFSDKYQPAVSLSIMLMIAASIAGCFATLPVTLLAKGQATTLLRLNSLSTIAYFIILPPSLIQFGVEAAGITAIAYQLLWFVLLNRASSNALNLKA